MMGIAMKSLTSSKKILTILNRLGHSVSYTKAEELETDMTFSSLQENQIFPPGVVLAQDLRTNVAWDNFDRFVETLSGKNTLHDTVGILY